jgi:hypothetical protein
MKILAKLEKRRTNALAYFVDETVAIEKGFIAMAPGIQFGCCSHWE